MDDCTIELDLPCKVRDVTTVPQTVQFSPAQLLVRDGIYGGARRRATVELGTDEGSEFVYLKSVERLKKMEFEDIFGFAPGTFVAGRVIQVPAKSVTANAM